MNSISGVTMPRRAWWSWVTGPVPRSALAVRAASPGDMAGVRAGTIANDRASLTTSPRDSIQGCRNSGSPVADVVALRAARVVDAKGRLATAERDLAHRDAQVAGLDIDLSGVRER